MSRRRDDNVREKPSRGVLVPDAGRQRRFRYPGAGTLERGAGVGTIVPVAGMAGTPWEIEGTIYKQNKQCHMVTILNKGVAAIHNFVILILIII